MADDRGNRRRRCGAAVARSAAATRSGAWGSDHVGQPVPEFTSGDECLFCHRDVGPNWPVNRHGQTIREINLESDGPKALSQSPALREVAAAVELILGDNRRQRFLKRGKDFGKLDLLRIEWQPQRDGAAGKLIGDLPRWNNTTFGDSCAGCHSSGVDSKSRTFTAASLDCFVCHGQIPEQHTTQPALAHFSKKKREPAQTIASICGQCHLRTGKSKSTDLPIRTTSSPATICFAIFPSIFPMPQSAVSIRLIPMCWKTSAILFCTTGRRSHAFRVTRFISLPACVTIAWPTANCV